MDELGQLRAENKALKAQLAELANFMLPVMEAMRPFVLNYENVKYAANKAKESAE